MAPETFTQKLFRLWHSSLTNDEIEDALGIGSTKLAALAKLHKLEKRNTLRLANNEQPWPGDPTPEEIQAGMAAIQAEWSEDERLKRFQGKKRVAFVAPTYGYDGRVTAFDRKE